MCLTGSCIHILVNNFVKAGELISQLLYLVTHRQLHRFGSYLHTSHKRVSLLEQCEY